jgi:hypothetical protein
VTIQAEYALTTNRAQLTTGTKGDLVFEMRGPAVPQLDLAYVVQTDGTIDLGHFGAVRVVGMTVAEARSAVQERLAKYFDSPQVAVEVVGYNSNRYYVIIGGRWIGGVSTETGNENIQSPQVSPTMIVDRLQICSNCESSIPITAEIGQRCPYCGAPFTREQIAALNDLVVKGRDMWLNEHGLSSRKSPFVIRGNETVLDALSKIHEVQGLPPMSFQSIWIARPAPADYGQEQILSVNWKDISQGITDTNYQILPGDRLYIADDRMTTVNRVMGNFTDPISRLVDMASQGVAAARGTQTLGRDFNKLRQN